LSFIEIAGVSKFFGPRHVLDDVSLSIERGEFVSIVGVMGCGKSTLVAIAAGLAPPDSGTITVAGQPLTGVRRDAAIVFQNYSLLPWFSALENVRLAVHAAFPDETRAQHLERARRAVAMVGLGNAEHRRPGQLSGGMRQRVAIARAFAIEPEVLFLDEPFSALDALTRETLQQELLRLCSGAGRPVTALMITNNVEEAILLSDRIVPMTRGPRARLGAPLAVDLQRPRSVEQLANDEHAVHVRARIVETLTSGFRAGTSSRVTTRNTPAAASAETLPPDNGRILPDAATEGAS
jgi:ABC-type nitrate/sulfonate/bicarbonate transport system ATPase subunit